jgi:hypothetical protein
MQILERWKNQHCPEKHTGSSISSVFEVFGSENNTHRYTEELEILRGIT